MAKDSHYIRRPRPGVAGRRREVPVAVGWVLRYSYVLGAAVLLGAVAALGLRYLEVGLALLVVLAVAAALAVVWVLLRRGAAPPSPEKRLKKVLGAGRPVLVHFYSDYSLISLAQVPVLAAVERRWRGQVEFLYVDANDPQGRALASRLGVGVLGTVLFDARGQEVCRGLPRAGHWQAALARPAQP